MKSAGFRRVGGVNGACTVRSDHFIQRLLEPDIPDPLASNQLRLRQGHCEKTGVQISQFTSHHHGRTYGCLSLILIPRNHSITHQRVSPSYLLNQFLPSVSTSCSPPCRSQEGWKSCIYAAYAFERLW